MGVEIERKYLLHPDVAKNWAYETFLAGLSEYPSVYVQDYYFNEYTRLRMYDHKKQFITIKSNGFFAREEHEFEVQPNDFNPEKTLNKVRFRKSLDSKHVLEINVYNQVVGPNGKYLVLIEVELDTEMDNIILPKFVGKEVTFDKNFYNYYLFNLI